MKSACPGIFLAAALSWLLAAVPAQAEFRVGLVLDKGGKDDKSFNAAAYAGATQAKTELKISLKAVEATDDNAFEPLLRALARRNYDLIIGIGFSQAEAMRKVARDNPGRHFAVVDAPVDAPNVRAILFEEQEGSFLVGAIAGLTSQTKKVGFVGGMDIPLIRRFEMGYEAGVKAADPAARVQVNYVGITAEAWNNPGRAKELALNQYFGGVDVIFSAAGASTQGIFDAADEKKRYAIGVDSNQNWVKPGRILTSMMKRVDRAVYQVCKDSAEGRFGGGISHMGLANGGVDYAMDQYNASLISPATLAKVEEMKKHIIAGKLRVPDYYQLKR